MDASAPTVRFHAAAPRPRPPAQPCAALACVAPVSFFASCHAYAWSLLSEQEDAAAAAAASAPVRSPSPGAPADSQSPSRGADESPAAFVIEEASRALAAATPAAAAAAEPSAATAASADAPATAAAASPRSSGGAASASSGAPVRRRPKKAAPRPSAGGLAIGFTAEELRAQAAKRAAWMREEVRGTALCRAVAAAPEEPPDPPI